MSNRNCMLGISYIHTIYMCLYACVNIYSLLIPFAANASKNFVISKKITANGYLYLIGGEVVVSPYFNESLLSYFLRCVLGSACISLSDIAVVNSKSDGSAEIFAIKGYYLNRSLFLKNFLISHFILLSIFFIILPSRTFSYKMLS